MADPATFLAVSRALCATLPPAADVVGMEVANDDVRTYVTVWTSTPAQMIGQRGVTAARVREALEEAAGSEVHLLVEEADEEEIQGPPPTGDSEALLSTAPTIIWQWGPPPPRVPRPPKWGGGHISGQAR